MRGKTRRVTRRRRTYKVRGGGTTSCTDATLVHILENQVKTADPSQGFCFGDEFTTCLAIVVVMEDGHKIAAHINPSTYVFKELGDLNMKFINSIKNKNKKNMALATINPTNIIEKIDNEIRKLKGDIKKIYVVTAMNDIVIWNEGKNINNNQSAARKGATARTIQLNYGNKSDFFKRCFGDKVTDKTEITIRKGVEVQASRGGHFFVEANGRLNIN